MSKSLNQIFLPALGGAALVVSGAIYLASGERASNRIETLETRLAQVEAHEAAARTEISDAQARASALQAELEAKAAELETAAAMAVPSGGTLRQPAPVADGRLGLGRPALPEEVAAWNVDIMPDGRGLPEGSGDVLTGEEVFADNCASCHGDFAEGVDNWPKLAGGFDTLARKDPVKTVGSYWPYLSTVWDYVHRSMPFGAAQTLSNDEVYAIVAYILYSNDMVDEDFVLSKETFMDVEMHNAEGFVIDDRREAEYAMWSGEPCMTGCKDSVAITMHASVLDVTPEEDGAAAVVEDASASASEPVAEPEPAAEPAGAEAAAPEDQAALDPALVAEGEGVFRKCKSCHQIGAGAKNRSGPQLNGIIGRAIGGVEGFRYSGTFEEANAAGRTWTEDELKAFLAKPKAYMKGTKMSFAGLKSDADLAAIVAYLQAASN